MPLRKLLLRLMLASLAFSALAGILAVLTAGQEVVWRVTSTGLLAAVASGFMLVLSRLIDKEKSRAAGLLGMSAVVVSFLLGLLLTWDFSFFSNSWAPVLTLLLVLGATPPLMFFLRVIYADRGKWAGIVGVAGCGIAALLLHGTIWGEQFRGYSWAITENLTASAWAMSALGAIAAGSLAGVGVDRRWWRWIGVGASAAALVMALIGIWAHVSSNGVPFAVVIGLAVITAHANLAFLCNLRRGQEWLRWATVGAVVVTSLLLDIIVAEGNAGGFDDLISRAAAASAIAAGCGTLALLVLARLNRNIATATIPTGVKELAIVCPWCNRKQTLPLGASSCAGCGLKFQIAVQEPRCPNCDYLLYMLASDRCPECGVTIRAQAEMPTT